MKNYYDIEKMNSISEKMFVNSFKKSKASITGIISVFGDTLGQPGDTLYSLSKLTVENQNVFFDFLNSKITVVKANMFFVNEMIIAIKECEKVVWHDDTFNIKIEYDYSKKNNIVNTNIIEGNHVPIIKLNEPCLIISSW